MADIKFIEKAVEALAAAELAEFRRWFAEFDSAAWDRQIEQDALNGKLDRLAAEAVDRLDAVHARREDRVADDPAGLPLLLHAELDGFHRVRGSEVAVPGLVGLDQRHHRRSPGPAPCLARLGDFSRWRNAFFRSSSPRIDLIYVPSRLIIWIRMYGSAVMGCIWPSSRYAQACVEFANPHFFKCHLKVGGELLRIE